MAAAEITREGDPRRAARQAAAAGITNEGDPSCAAATKFGRAATGITGEGGPDAAAGPDFGAAVAEDTRVGDPDATVVCLSHMYDLCLLTLPSPDTPDWEPLGLTPVWRWKAHVLKLPARQRGRACFFEPADAMTTNAQGLSLALGRRCNQLLVARGHVVVSHASPWL